MKSTTEKTVQHDKNRYQFAIQHFPSREVDLSQAILSEETKFNVDSPHGFGHYCQDMRKEPREFSKRQQPGKSVTVLGAMFYRQRPHLVLITDKHTSVTYTEVLRHDLLDFAERTVGDPFIFHEDNAATYKTISSTDWLSANGVYRMDSLARPPDLNPIENFWGILASALGKHRIRSIVTFHTLFTVLRLRQVSNR